MSHANYANKSNPLAIGAFVTGIIAASGSWFPFLGLLLIPLAVIAIFLGIIGVLVSVLGSRPGFLAAFTGIGLGGLAVFLAVEMTNNTNKAIRDSLEQGSSAPRQTVKTLPTSRPRTTSKPKPEPIIMEAGSPFLLGPLEVRVVKVVSGKIGLMDSSGPGESEDTLLSIYLRTTNTDPALKFNYLKLQGGFDTGPSLQDEHGNVYKGLTFRGGSKPDGASESVSLYPRATISDQLVFELPVEAAETLILEIPGPKFDVRGQNVRFRIMTHRIEKR